MKKSILFVAMFSLMATTFAQEPTNIFDIKYKWIKTIGFSYQPGYKYGIAFAGGGLLSIGMAEDGASFDITTDATGTVTEKREPTWSLRCGWLGYTFDQQNTGWGAIYIRPMLVVGFNKAKVATRTVETSGDIVWEKENDTYFTMAPTVSVNLWAVHFAVGYEFVPKFKEINGLNFTVGFSIPFNSKAMSDRLERMTSEKK